MTAPRRGVEAGPAGRAAAAEGRRPRSFLTPVLALAAAVAVGMGGASSYAYWQDTARVTTGEITAGTLDLQVDGNAVGQGTGFAKTTVTATGLYPGERLAFPMAVRNVGGASVRYSATVAPAASPTWGYDGTAITVQVVVGSTTPAGTSYPRAGSCTGTTLTAAPVAVAPSGDPRTLFSGRGPLSGDTTETLCLLVAMPGTASNANQGKTGAMVIDLVAEQVVP